MDEKGILMGILHKARVIISKHDMQKYITQPGSREFTTIIECISINGRVIKPFIIFKGKQMKKAWFNICNSWRAGGQQEGLQYNEAA